jgi:DNA-binding IclR family transcriptional regulator
VLDKAFVVLGALEAGPVTLSGLMARTGLPRATAHRLAAALEVHGAVERDHAGRYQLGARLAELGRRAGAGRNRSLVETALPRLVRLRDQTGESTQLFVRAEWPDGDTRVCVASLESPHGLRTIVPVGAVLPMDRGSAAKALAGGADVLAQGWAQSVEERERGVASVSAPVLVGGSVVAAISVSGPLERTTRQPGRRYAEMVTEAAAALAAELADQD